MDTVDIKDLQYQVVVSRRRAVKLVTDIVNAESKSAIKAIKEIENEPSTATKITYSPMNLSKLSHLANGTPKQSTDEHDLEDIAALRNTLKVLGQSSSIRGHVQ